MNENDLLSSETSEHEHAHEEQWGAVLMGEARARRNSTSRGLDAGWAPLQALFRPASSTGERRPPTRELRSVSLEPPPLSSVLPGGGEESGRSRDRALVPLRGHAGGSTSLAERIPAQEFSQLISRFYGTAPRVVDKWDGLVDKFVGDEVVALFIPGFGGEDHAQRAVGAARQLLETGNDGSEPWIPVGAGVHTAVAYVGRVGEDDACDFTVVGDAVKTTARLASSAGAGEILVSSSAAGAASLDTSGLETRTLALRGRDETVDAWAAKP